MDAPAHLLSLKVMRVSRPSLANSWQPFFTSSPSFSAHATESLLSLQGKEPLPGHPKTLRDLTHASQLLTLPSSFGAIQLGETFTSCLCVNNEANIGVEGVSLRIEMQTATNKVVLAEVGGPGQQLKPTEVLEALVSHEMKELGQHVLACYVSYRLPPSVQNPPGPADDPTDPSLQTFRKYYKFAVTNPLNVKTKVHVPRSPTAMLSRSERDKVFLEIHVQNLTQEPMWFETMRFECVDGWKVQDGNLSQKDGKNLFSGSAAIMQPQDIRQYVYILTPTSVSSFPVVHPPGSIIPLGRLDLAWRSSFGEPGRLLTSLLTRRIPVSAPHTAASALPHHLQRAGTPVRPRSPQQTLSRPSTPPGSPGAFKPRPPSQQITRSQSPVSIVSSSSLPAGLTDLEVDLIVRSIPHSDIQLERPFQVAFELTVSGVLPGPARTRMIYLVLQHLQHSRPPLVNGSTLMLPPNASPRPSIDAWSPRSQQNHTHHLQAPDSPAMSPRRGGPFNFGHASGQVYIDSPLATHTSETRNPTPEDVEGHRNADRDAVPARGYGTIRLPAPSSASAKPTGVLPLGASTLFLPPVELTRPPPVITAGARDSAPVSSKGEAVREFECTFVAMRKGFATVGGLRVLLVEDREIDTQAEQTVETVLIPHGNAEARVLREWDVVGEVWVTS